MSADLSHHAWPLRPVGGQQTLYRGGVLVLHEPTGIAVVCESERSQLANRERAEERLRGMLAVLDAARAYVAELRCTDHRREEAEYAARDALVEAVEGMRP